jgi:hypothetical protein
LDLFLIGYSNGTFQLWSNESKNIFTSKGGSKEINYVYNHDNYLWINENSKTRQDLRLYEIKNGEKEEKKLEFLLQRDLKEKNNETQILKIQKIDNSSKTLIFWREKDKNTNVFIDIFDFENFLNNKLFEKEQNRFFDRILLNENLNFSDSVHDLIIEDFSYEKDIIFLEGVFLTDSKLYEFELESAKLGVIEKILSKGGKRLLDDEVENTFKELVDSNLIKSSSTIDTDMLFDILDFLFNNEFISTITDYICLTEEYDGKKFFTVYNLNPSKIILNNSSFKLDKS